MVKSRHFFDQFLKIGKIGKKYKNIKTIEILELVLVRFLCGYVGCRSSWKHPLPSFSKDLTQTKTTSSHTTSSPSFSPPLIQMVNKYIDTLHRQTQHSLRFLF